MYTHLLAMIAGIPLTFAGQLFFKFIKKALQERRENEATKAEAIMKIMIEKAIDSKGR